MSFRHLVERGYTKIILSVPHSNMNSVVASQSRYVPTLETFVSLGEIPGVLLLASSAAPFESTAYWMVTDRMSRARDIGIEALQRARGFAAPLSSASAGSTTSSRSESPEPPPSEADEY